MKKLQGTIINDTIYPASTGERFPTHDALYGKGGYRSVKSLSDRDAIPIDRLEVGCEVRVMEEEGSPVYYLASLDPLTWELVPTSSINEEQISEIVDSTLMEKSGKENGIASLDENRKVNQDQLPDSVKGRVIQGRLHDDDTFLVGDDEIPIPIDELDSTSVYIDKYTGSIYSWDSSNNKFKGTLSWVDVV